MQVTLRWQFQVLAQILTRPERTVARGIGKEFLPSANYDINTGLMLLPELIAFAYETFCEPIKVLAFPVTLWLQGLLRFRCYARNRSIMLHRESMATYIYDFTCMAPSVTHCETISRILNSTFVIHGFTVPEFVESCPFLSLIGSSAVRCQILSNKF